MLNALVNSVIKLQIPCIVSLYYNYVMYSLVCKLV